MPGWNAASGAPIPDRPAATVQRRLWWRAALCVAAWWCAMPLAADQNELRALREAIDALAAEQQALYQQFQMLQALRMNEQRYAAEAYAPDTGPPRNYDDVVRKRQAALDRAAAYQAEMDELYERYRQIELEKRPLLERLRALSLETPAEP